MTARQFRSLITANPARNLLRFAVILILILSGTTLLFSQSQEDANNPRIKQVLERPPPAFYPGENLEYQVSWLGMKAGTSYMNVDVPEKLNDITVWPLRSGAETTGLIKRLYRIDNSTVSFFDPLNWYPLRFEVEQYSGGREETIVMNFDQVGGKVSWYRNYNKKKSEGTSEISRGVQDTFSSIYYLRNQRLEVGKSVRIPIYVSKKRWVLQANVIKKERIEVPAGTFDTLFIKPIMLPESEGESKGTMELWFTDDERHIPVQVSSEVPVGSVMMKLTSMKPGKPPREE